LGDREAAIAAWSAARTLDARRDDRGFEGYDWFLIGQAQLQLDRAKEGVDSLTRALPLLSQAIDRDHEADARVLMAFALTERGEPETALEHLERSLELARVLDDPRREAAALAQLGRVDLIRGEPGPAVEWLSEAREGFLALGEEAEAAAMDRVMGEAMIALELPDVALARVESAAESHQRLEAPALLGDDLRFLAGIQLEQGNLPAARELAGRAAAAFRSAEDPTGEIDALVALARGQGFGNDWTAAASTLRLALGLVRQHGEPSEQVRLLILAADIERRADHVERSSALLDEAQSIARRADNGALKKMIDEAKQGAR
jgi:tetratricopeptide (TPR) repeat protein